MILGWVTVGMQVIHLSMQPVYTSELCLAIPLWVGAMGRSNE